MPTNEQPDRTRPNPARRTFLKQAALLAGAGVAASAFTPPAAARRITGRGVGKMPTPPRDGEPVRLAIIGTGGMGRAHIDAFSALRDSGRCNVEIVALCDVNDLHAADAVKRTAAGGQPSTPRTTRDHREILADPDIHAVLIATPEHNHAPIAMDAIMAGKDVYCEKPMTLDLDQALVLRETVLANPQTIFCVGTQKIMLPKFREAKKLIESGAIGTPVFSQTSYCRNAPDGEWNYYEIDPEWKPGVNLDWDRWLAPKPHHAWDPKLYIRWRRYRAFSTGIIGDLLVHEMTPLMMALESCGWPRRVVAAGSHLVDLEMENHDQVNLIIEFESGHQMTVAGSTSNEVGLENLIRGHEGNLYLNSRHCEFRPTRPFVDFAEPRRIECPDIGNDQDALRVNFIDSVRSRQQPDSTVDLGTRVMVAVDLATRSIWDGGAWGFDRTTMTARRL